jgi:hypothetical protein
MKRMMIALTLIFAASAAHASILLTTPYTVSGPAGTTGTGTATNATITNKIYDYGTKTYSITWQLGSVLVSAGKDQAFTALPGAPTVTARFNTVTGSLVVTANGTTQYDQVLTGSTLAAFIAAFQSDTTIQNSADSWATENVPFLAGTQPDTW